MKKTTKNVETIGFSTPLGYSIVTHHGNVGSIGTTNSTAVNSAAGAATGTTDNSTNQNSNAGITGGAADNTSNQNVATNNGTKNNNQTNTSTASTGENNGTK